MSKLKRKPYTVRAGRAIYRDEEPYFTVMKALDVENCEADELCHILAALLNTLGDDEIATTYLDGKILRLQRKPPHPQG